MMNISRESTADIWLRENPGYEIISMPDVHDLDSIDIHIRKGEELSIQTISWSDIYKLDQADLVKTFHLIFETGKEEIERLLSEKEETK